MTEGQQRIDSFLMDYAAICEKHGIIVYGSPRHTYLVRLDNWKELDLVPEEVLAQHIKHLRDT